MGPLPNGLFIAYKWWLLTSSVRGGGYPQSSLWFPKGFVRFPLKKTKGFPGYIPPSLGPEGQPPPLGSAYKLYNLDPTPNHWESMKVNSERSRVKKIVMI